METKFKVGDPVTFLNDQGCKFPEKVVTKIVFTDDGEARYFIDPKDSFWVPVREDQLIHDSEDPVIAEFNGHKIRESAYWGQKWFLVGLTSTSFATLEQAKHFAETGEYA